MTEADITPESEQVIPLTPKEAWEKIADGGPVSSEISNLDQSFKRRRAEVPNDVVTVGYIDSVNSVVSDPDSASVYDHVRAIQFLVDNYRINESRVPEDRKDDFDREREITSQALEGLMAYQQSQEKE